MSEKEEGPELPMEIAEKSAETEKDGEEKAKPVPFNDSAVIPDDGNRVLSSIKKGESNIEKFANQIETRRANRLPVTFDIRKLFPKKCRDAAQREGLSCKIPYATLVQLRDEYKAKVEANETALTGVKRFFFKAFGFWDKDNAMLLLFEKGLEHSEECDTRWFFYRDFNFYHTVITPKMRIFSTPAKAAMSRLLIFYFFSAILFCPIMRDESVCPAGESSYDGWLTSVYFASVTMSTVGYGDVSLSGGERWRTFIGVVYMLVSLIVGYTVFASAAEAAMVNGFDIDGSGRATPLLFRPFVKKFDPKTTPLYKQVQRITFFRVSELLIYFFALNLVGMFAARIFIHYSDDDGEQWDWMTTFYWAVQTTTTIGYGDLEMPFELRWFQIFFTTLGTAFVGSVFGGIASLKNDIMDLRRFYAWKRREVSKHLIEDMQGPEADNKVDQFEFLVGSLLMLNKIGSSDVEQIMEKFRELAGDKGFIMHEDAEKEAENLANRNDAEGNKAEDEDMMIDMDVANQHF